MGNWLIQVLRATIFQSGQPDHESVWLAVVGTPAQVIDRRSPDGVTTLTGVIEGYQLQMVVSDKVDWLLQPHPSQPLDDQPAIPTLGDHVAALNVLIKIVDRWVDVTDSTVTRVAFGAELTSPVDNLAIGYRELREYLAPLADLYAPDSTDFLCQMNRPRPASSYPDYMINRITQWSVPQYSTVELTISPEGQSQHVTVTFHRKLDLDINTAPQIQVVDRMHLKDLFQELVTMGSEIAQGSY